MTVTLKPVKNPLFPTLGSLEEAATLIQGQLPITDPNKLYALLMMYRNTLIQELEQLNDCSLPKHPLQESR